MKSNPELLPCLIWNSNTRHFALTSYDIASAMLHIGNTEGFNRISRNPGPSFRVITRQTGPKCSVDIETKSQTYTHECSRTEAKQLAAQLHKAFGWPVFNVKTSGKMVRVTL